MPGLEYHLVMSLRSARGESRWPVLLALATVVVLYIAMPEKIVIGPDWLLAVFFVVLALLVLAFHAKGDVVKTYVSGMVLLSGVTLELITSLTLLIISLPHHVLAPVDLLKAATSLWIGNVLIFAAWYWKLDAGGPHKREKLRRHESGAFLFPQMALHEESPAKHEAWHPQFVDYLFLSFTTSTALSPTDTPVLSRWAKTMMIVQSSVSLTVIALLAARAVNIL